MITELFRKNNKFPKEIKCSCGGAAKIKEISSSSFHLKGKGFYETDYKDAK